MRPFFDSSTRSSVAPLRRHPTTRRMEDEAYLPTERPQAGQEARLSKPDVHPRRSRGTQEPPSQGPPQAGCLIRGISDRATFDRLRRQGDQVRSRDFRVRYLLEPDGEDSTRVAYAMTRKVGTAVVRNRLRRQIRGVLNELVADDRELPQGALLFIAHTSAAGLSYPELRTQVVQMMENIEKSRVSER